MAAKKADQDIQLSEELQSIVDTVVSKLTDDTNSIDMNTVQVECLARDITSDDDINMVFEALRERGVSLDDEDVDIDDVLDDEFKDVDDEDNPELAAAREEARVANEELRAAAKRKSSKRSRRSRARRIDSSTVMLTGDPVRMYLKEIGKVDLLTADDEVHLAMKIEAGNKATEQLEKAEKGEIELSRSEMRRLMREEQVGLDAKQALTSANLRLTVSIAKRYVGRGMLFLDLIQEGNLGLIRAVEKFDYTKALSFQPMPPGGYVRQLPVLLPTRRARFVFRFTWLKPSTNWCASSVSCCRSSVAILRPRKSAKK